MKSLLIPVAAFAVTATGASAFSGDMLKNAGLNDAQVAAFEQAKDLREAGDRDGARDVLAAAGIDDSVINKIRAYMSDHRQEHRSAILDALENDDYEAFQTAIDGSPLADIVNTKAEFEQLVEAYDDIEAGDWQSAQAILDDLGVKLPPFDGIHDGTPGDKSKWDGKEPPFLSKLTDSQKSELKTAFQNHDHDKLKSILEDAGITLPGKGIGFGFGLGIHTNHQDKRDQGN